MFGVPPPPQVSGIVQPPQCAVPPHESGMSPHAPSISSHRIGMHGHIASAADAWQKLSSMHAKLGGHSPVRKQRTVHGVTAYE
jgi:hypothetical protein